MYLIIVVFKGQRLEWSVVDTEQNQYNGIMIVSIMTLNTLTPDTFELGAATFSITALSIMTHNDFQHNNMKMRHLA